MSAVVIGIDADVHRVAYAAVCGERVLGAGTIERANSKGRIDERYDQGLTALMRRAQEIGAVVWLEGIYLAEDGSTSQARNVQGFRALAEVHGEIRREARRHGVPVEEAAPSAWHSAVLGFVRGRDALKLAAQSAAGRAWAGELTEHEADAVCVALYGCERMRVA